MRIHLVRCNSRDKTKDAPEERESSAGHESKGICEGLAANARSVILDLFVELALVESSEVLDVLERALLVDRTRLVDGVHRVRSTHNVGDVVVFVRRRGGGGEGRYNSARTKI